MFLTLKERYRLRVFQNNVLKKIFGFKMEQMNAGINSVIRTDLYSSHLIL